MTMKIQDDFYEAAKQLPEEQQADFIMAIVRYGFEGEEPQGSPPWLPVFTVIKGRIRMSCDASEKGRNMAKARWGEKKVPSSQSMNACTMLQHDAQDMHEHDADTMLQQNAEYEYEIEKEINPPIVPPYAQACMLALNEVLGTTYSTMPERCSRTISRFEGAYSVDDVRAMVEAKRREWQADAKTRKWLSPGTLFAPDKFEKYMIQTESDRREEARFDAYDI